MSGDYCQAGAAGVVSHTNESNTAIAKEDVKKGFLQNLWIDMNIDLLVFIKCKFLRILNYSQSFQEQLVTFSTVIILSDNEKNTEYSCT